MTLEEILLKVLEGGPGNPVEISARLESRVRKTLNDMADQGKIEKRSGQRHEYVYGFKHQFKPPLPEITRR